MIKYFVTLCALLSILQLNAVETLEEEKVRLVAEQYSSQSKSWPTLKWKEAPLIITFENGHIYAIGLESSSEIWKNQKLGGQDVRYTDQNYQGLQDIRMNPWFEIEGQKAFVYRMEVNTKAVHDATVLAHERFHRHQMENFEPPAKMGMPRDHLNVENLTWSEIEDQLFRAFLAAGVKEKQELISDIAAVLSLRRSLIAEETVAWENHQTKIEGLADYAATKLFGGEKALLQMHPALNQDSIIDGVIKWRHYLAGATLGFALDALNVPDWKQQIEDGHDLADLFLQATPLSNAENEKRLQSIKKRFSYERKHQAIEKQINAYKKELDALYSNYDHQKGVKLFLGHPPLSISGGGSNAKLYYLANGTTINTDDESISTTQDGQWKFTTHRISHLFQHKNGIREVKVSDGANLVLDNISMPLKEVLKKPREYFFHSLKIDGDSASISSEGHPGKLVSDGQTVQVKFRNKMPSHT